MLKKVFFYTVVYLLATPTVFSQCPVSVEISADQTGELCKNTIVNFTAQPTNGGANPSYTWLVNGDTVGSTSAMSSSTNGAFVELIMISSSGCAQDSAYDSHYILNTSIQAEYSVPELEECNQPTNDVSILNITGGTEPYTYYLHTAEEDLDQSNFYGDLPISSYPLIVTDANNCQDTTWINLTTMECEPINPVDVFTPNDDGQNDTWYIINIQYYPKNKVYIFDRWGQRVYYKEGYDNQNGWDAKYMGGDLPVTTFFYVIELEFDRQDNKIYKGAVSILR